MSQLLYSYFLKKLSLDHIADVGESENDPYFETIPDNELHFYQRKGAKRKKKLPGFIPKQDLKILNSIKNSAYRLDLQLSMCGIRLGWAGIIGLIPWIGDAIAFYFAYSLVQKAKTVDGGISKVLEAEMMSNVLLDFGIGLIPIVGDLINIMYKCNSRNFILLEKHLIKKYEGTNHAAEPTKATTEGSSSATNKHKAKTEPLPEKSKKEEAAAVAVPPPTHKPPLPTRESETHHILAPPPDVYAKPPDVAQKV